MPAGSIENRDFRRIFATLPTSRHIRFFLLVLIMFFVIASPGQCAMCKQAAETSMKSDPNSVARGLNKGILYLMAVPYVMIAFIFRKQLYAVWKKVSSRFSGSRVS
jgi:hypothetical protein